MPTDRLALARRVLADEADALRRLAADLDDAFTRVVAMILSATGPAAPHGQVVVSGLGKSGLVARKIAATLTSTGTPAVFLHPVEALHGDLGLVSRGDVCLALSKNGSDELVRFAQHFRELGGRVAAMTAKRAHNALADVAEATIFLPDVKEACPLELAPTTSTTMMLALGDALAAALLEARGFSSQDFARYHPAGTLGRRLVLRVGDLMHAGQAVPVVADSASFSDMLAEMSKKALGLVCVVGADQKLAGVLTDGDLRRLIERSDNVRSLTIPQALERSPRIPGQRPPPVTVRPDTLGIACRELMDRHVITSLAVVDEAGRPVGIIRMHDLLVAGLG